MPKYRIRIVGPAGVEGYLRDDGERTLLYETAAVFAHADCAEQAIDYAEKRYLPNGFVVSLDSDEGE